MKLKTFRLLGERRRVQERQKGRQTQPREREKARKIDMPRRMDAWGS